MDNNTGYTKKNYKVAVVTGSSSGIGLKPLCYWQEMASIRMLQCVILTNQKKKE